MKAIRWGLLAALGGTILVLGGCGYFSGLFSGNQGTIPSADEVWVDHGVWAEAELSPLALGGEKPETPRFVPGQLIVKFKDGQFTDAAIAAFCGRHGVQLRGRVNQLRLILVSLPQGRDLEAARVAFASEVAVVDWASLNRVYEFLGTGSEVEAKAITNDPYYPIQWGMERIGFNQIPASVLPTTTPIIAVVDSGVDYNHPDLRGKVIRGPDYWDGDMDPMDATGHGTHVAGIAAAFNNNNLGVAGVSGPSRVLAVRIGSWWIPEYAGAAGIVYAATQAGVKVINLSWGGYSDSQAIQDAVAYAVGRGILVVAAAGNDDSTDPMYPAAYPDVLAVGATDWEDRKACFSNYGDYVDIAAPGEYIVSTVRKTYWEVSGTSMAAPFVAGAAALVWGKWPTMTAHGVADLLCATGDPLYPEYEECGTDQFPVWVRRLSLYNAFIEKLGSMPAAGGAIYGMIVDANTGIGLPGATVTATRVGGGTVRTAITRSDGTFTVIQVPAGTYEVRASKSGYIATPYPWPVSVYEAEWSRFVFISPPKTQPSDVYTVVVPWYGWYGCYDLDSYLWLPATLPDAQKYMVCWWNRGDLARHPFAVLLRDEPQDLRDERRFRPWWGVWVETTLFRTRYRGTYLFAVKDYWGYCCWDCRPPIVAHLYKGNALLRTFRAEEASGEGEWWKVFSITGATITPHQELTGVFPGPYGEGSFLGSPGKARVPEPPPGVPVVPEPK